MSGLKESNYSYTGLIEEKRKIIDKIYKIKNKILSINKEIEFFDKSEKYVLESINISLSNSLNNLNSILSELNKKLKERKELLKNYQTNQVKQLKNKINNILSYLNSDKNAKNLDKEKFMNIIQTLNKINREINIDNYSTYLEKVAQLDMQSQSYIVEFKTEQANRLKLKVDILIDILSNSTNIKKWYPNEFNKFKNEFINIKKDINLNNYNVFTEKLKLIENKFIDIEEKSNILENSYEIRNTIIKEIKNIYENKGFKIIQEGLEDEDNLQSDYILKVNTYSEGIIELRITFDKIRGDFPMSEKNGYCMEKAKELSEKLKKIGIKTDFIPVNENDEPRLLTKDEADLPIDQNNNINEIYKRGI